MRPSFRWRHGTPSRSMTGRSPRSPTARSLPFLRRRWGVGSVYSAPHQPACQTGSELWSGGPERSSTAWVYSGRFLRAGSAFVVRFLKCFSASRKAGCVPSVDTMD